MAIEAEILVNNYGLPLGFAQDFLKFTNNDVEAAIKIIESSDKNMIVLKSKFISSKKLSYGAFMYFYNTETNHPEYVFSVVSKNANLSRINLESNWKDLLEEFFKYTDTDDYLPEYSFQIESQLVLDETVNNLSIYLVDKSKIDLANIKRYLLSEITKIIMDSAIILKLINENIEIFKFKFYSSNLRLGYNTSVAKNDWIVLLNLEIEPVLAPLGGVDIENVKVGDEILAKVTDTREIAKYIINIKNPGFDESIYGKVVLIEKSPETNNIHTILEFGTGIFGRFVIGEKIRVQLNEKKRIQADAVPVNSPDKSQAPAEAYDKDLKDDGDIQKNMENDKTIDDNQMEPVIKIGPFNVKLLSLFVVASAVLIIVLLLFFWLFS